MRIERPIVVCCMGRTGSSMVTGTLALHGAWTGRCHGPDARRNPKGYWENIAIKRKAESMVPRSRIGRIHEALPGWPDFVHQTLRDEGYSGGPWVVKHFASFWKSWAELDPLWVLPRRDPESILRSTRRAGFWSWAEDGELRRVIQAHLDVLDHLRDNFGGVEVFSDKVVSGDRRSLARAVEHAGLRYDDEIARSFIEPGFWGRKP